MSGQNRSSNTEININTTRKRRLGVLARHILSVPLQNCLNHTENAVVTQQQSIVSSRSSKLNHHGHSPKRNVVFDWYFNNNGTNNGGAPLKSSSNPSPFQSSTTSLNNQFLLKREKEEEQLKSASSSPGPPLLLNNNSEFTSSDKDIDMDLEEQDNKLLSLLLPSNDNKDHLVGQQEDSTRVEDFEERKRKLLILLDQAVEAKMKISKAFPEKLALFGRDLSKYNLNWHPGWREPERFVPEIDCDPYRGACSVSSCACQLFQSWPIGEEGNELYVYNPKIVNSETELCRECHHLKSDHYLATKADRSKYKEFSQEALEKYAVQVSEDLPPKHPSETPTHLLAHYYEENPLHPGASPNVNKLKLLEETEESDKKKSMSSMNMDDDFGDDDDPLADGF